MKVTNLVLVGLLVCAGAGKAQAAIEYSNGFEVDTNDWASTTRVGTGTGGVPSADGAFHGVASAGAFTRWDGYNFGAGAVPTPFQEYRTSVDIYLNVGGGAANDTRFDFTSAINNAAGTHLRDFAFNVGFYNDASAPGSGNRFVVSASNNVGRSGAYPKNPERDPFAIASTGWYTFENSFRNVGGFLVGDLSIFDSANSLIHSWTLTTTDAIAGVGGNRYGWFPYNEFGSVPIDNALMVTADTGVVPEPLSLMVWVGLAFAAITVAHRRTFRESV